MDNLIKSKSQTPLHFKAFHTLLGLAVFFSLITIPGEHQVIRLFDMTMSSDYLWWPIVFLIFHFINAIYGFSYLRHAVYLIIIFRTIYILFLKLAVALPPASFWKLEAVYTHLLNRDFLYILKSAILLWCCTLLSTKLFILSPLKKHQAILFLFNLMIFSALNTLILNPNTVLIAFNPIPIFLIYSITAFFSQVLIKSISNLEKIEMHEQSDYGLFRFGLHTSQLTYNNLFKYHHLLFCSSILFYIASKTMAAKFISIGFFTMDVGAIVFSFAYLILDMMTDVYGIERTKQMIAFVIFANLLLTFDIWATNFLAINNNTEFKSILNNQARICIASGIAFFLGTTINSTVISIMKSKQRKRGISLKKEFITTVWTRVATSSAFGIILDVSFFCLIAFYGIVPNKELPSIIFFENVYIITYEILFAPLSVLLIYLLKIREKVDIYDEISNLYPFKINTNYQMSANKFNENYINLMMK